MSFDMADYRARLEAWSDIQGHLEFMREAVAGYAEPVVIELGVRSGNSTSAFLAGAAGNGGHLWSADRNPPDVPASWRDLPQWHFLQSDDMHPAAAQWLPAACDVLFIDTSHAYEHTLAELRLYVPRVRAGGMVLMHDTHWSAGDGELEDPAGPVARALDEFCAGAGLSWEDRPGSYGMGVIRL